jgi:fructose-1,6-bisphosphatase I
MTSTKSAPPARSTGSHPATQPRITRDNLATLQGHILAEEQKHPGASGDLSWILSAMSLAAKTIANKVRRARIEDVLGDYGEENIHGEGQQKLDVIANEILLRCLGNRPSVAVVASEEDENPLIIRCGHEGGKYCVIFDPLDGSSNLDVCVSVGTIFSILHNDPTIPGAVETLAQPGSRQVAAGYILYGSSTVFVLTTARTSGGGGGVDMFVLDQAIGSFVLVKPNLRIPATGKTYSVNEANRRTFPDGYNRYLDWAHASGYSSRYIGSMVADVHRTLLKGGVFLYPPTKKNPEGKLRLMYEANPMAMIIENAGGKAVTGGAVATAREPSPPGTGQGEGFSARILDIIPTGIHQRTPIVIGSPTEVNHVLHHLAMPSASRQTA